MLVGAAIVVGLVNQMRRPRIAYRDGEVLFYLRTSGPIAVPVEVVEAFFLGQGPLMLPLQQQSSDTTVNLVARIAERATDWQEREVKPALGRWCDGHVTIRGTWCETLDSELIRRLNHRLREVSQVCAQ
jgi:hypothetical protein